MKKYERVKALVSLDAIAHNFEEMHKNVKEGTKIIAVIKADGYGHGARAIARLIQDYDYIWGFATATAEEALELRHVGITKPVLILGLVFEEYYEELAANDIRITISDLNTAAEYAKAGARIGKNVHIHLALDTAADLLELPPVAAALQHHIAAFSVGQHLTPPALIPETGHEPLAQALAVAVLEGLHIPAHAMLFQDRGDLAGMDLHSLEQRLQDLLLRLWRQSGRSSRLGARVFPVHRSASFRFF